MLRAVPFFFGKMKTEQKQLCGKEAAVRTKANGLDAINQTVGMIGYLGAVLILVVSVLKGSISVGAFAAVYYALNSLFDMVFALVCGFLGSAVGSLPAVENYVAFLERPGQELEGRAADGESDAVFGCFVYLSECEGAFD